MKFVIALDKGYMFNDHSDLEKRRKLRFLTPAAERRLWKVLKNKQLDGFKFRRQYGVGRFVLDFYCPSARLGIEIDGDSHFEDGAQKADAERTRFISSFDIRICRFMNQDIYFDLEKVLRKIRLELDPPLTKGELEGVFPTGRPTRP